MAREDYLDEVRLRNALNKQKAMQGASAGAQAAEKARREREIFQEMMAGLRANQAAGAGQAATVTNAPFTIDPSAFANPIQSVPPPAFKDFSLDPRAGGGGFVAGSTSGVAPGIAPPGVRGGAIDWENEAIFINDITGAVELLPANNPKGGGPFGIGGGDTGRDTGMTDEEFKLAWAKQYALGKKPPSGWQTLGGGTNAPTEREALKLLQSRGEYTGSLEPDANRWSQAKEDEARATDYRTKSFGGERADKAEVVPQITTTPSGLPIATAPAQPPQGQFVGGRSGADFGEFQGGATPQGPKDFRADPMAGGGILQDLLYRGEPYEIEQPVDRGGKVQIQPVQTTTPLELEQAQQEILEQIPVQQPVQTPSRQFVGSPSTGRGMNWDDFAEFQGDVYTGAAGEGGTTAGGGGSTAALQAQATEWTPQQWRDAGYELQPDGSWDIPAAAPAPAAALAPAGPGQGPAAGDSASGVSSAVTVPKIATSDALAAAALERQLIDEPTSQDVFTASQAPQPAGTPAAAQAATVAGTPAGTPAGMPAATAVNMAGGQDPWGSMYQASLSPRELWEQYRMQQFGDAPLGAQLAAQENLRYGFEPAMGRFMLGQAAGRITPTAETFTPGEQFGQYIRGGQQADLDEIRRNYQSLGGYLGSLGGGAPAAGTARYAQVFGAPGSEQDLRGNVLQATRAALGTNAFTGGGALGNIYDVMQRQYGAGGAGRFADWVGTAFQPQQQQQQFQQQPSGPSAQLLGTQQLQQNPSSTLGTGNWEDLDIFGAL